MEIDIRQLKTGDVFVLNGREVVIYDIRSRFSDGHIGYGKTNYTLQIIPYEKLQHVDVEPTEFFTDIFYGMIENIDIIDMWNNKKVYEIKEFIPPFVFKDVRAMSIRRKKLVTVPVWED